MTEWRGLTETIINLSHWFGRDLPPSLSCLHQLNDMSAMAFMFAIVSRRTPMVAARDGLQGWATFSEGLHCDTEHTVWMNILKAQQAKTQTEQLLCSLKLVCRVCYGLKIIREWQADMPMTITPGRFYVGGIKLMWITLIDATEVFINTLNKDLNSVLDKWSCYSDLKPSTKSV